jgi:hypothetical protein
MALSGVQAAGPINYRAGVPMVGCDLNSQARIAANDVKCRHTPFVKGWTFFARSSGAMIVSTRAAMLKIEPEQQEDFCRE